MVASATQPSPSDAKVIPNWPAESTRVRLVREVAVTAKRAKWSPPRTMASRRERRALTSANSTATKKALRANRATMANRRENTGESYGDCVMNRQSAERGARA
jgi:hypothetical protein